MLHSHWRTPLGVLQRGTKVYPPLPAWGSRSDEVAPRSRRKIIIYYHKLSCLPESHTKRLVSRPNHLMDFKTAPSFPLHPATVLYFSSSFFGELFPLSLLPSVISQGHTLVFNCPSSGLTRVNDL